MSEFDKFIKYGETRGCSYVELKEIILSNTVIQTVNNDVKKLNSNDDRVYAARVLYKGSFGLAYSNKSNWKDLVDKAIESARAIKKNLQIKEAVPLKKLIKTKVKIDPSEINLKEKKERIINLGERKKYPKICSLQKIYQEALRNYSITNSYGQYFNWKDSKIAFYSDAYSKEGTEQENFLKRFMNHAGFEIMERGEEIVNSSMDMAQKLLKAEHTEGGNFPIIADQELGGVFTHEAVGHATEADLVLQNVSVLKNQLGKKIANSKVNIIDDGTKKTYGWLPYDDEGIKASPTNLIKKGNLINYLQSLETASIMNVEPTGNGRAQFLSSMIIPRMTTTYIENGDDKFEEMVSSIKKGYYLKGTKGGVVNTQRGEFLFNSTYGYYIENGEIKNLVKGPSLMGNIMEILPKISMVGKDLEIQNGGHCGKCGQTVAVSDGSPHIKIDSAKVGGQK